MSTSDKWLYVPEQKGFLEWYRTNATRFEPPRGRTTPITTTLYVRRAMMAYDKEVLKMSRREWRKKWHESRLKR